MRLRHLVALGLMGLMSVAAGAAPASWDQPAAALAAQISDLLGPGRAYLIFQNLSSIPNDQLPAIRRFIEQDLEARGVVPAGADSATTVRVTLSESASERLWVAEAIEGDETRVAMVDAGPVSEPHTPAAPALMLRREQIFTAHTPILAALQTPGGWIALEPEEVVIYGQVAGGWSVDQRIPIGQTRPLPRDPRGVLWPEQNGQGFEAWLAGTACDGSYAGGQWTVDCHPSDDPWLIAEGLPATQPPVAPQMQTPQPQTAPAPNSAPPAAAVSLKAFYNAARDYFTGVVVPISPVELPAFYSAAYVPRPAGGEALLVGGIDGKVQLLEGDALTPIDGARDWGSDFAVLYSGCGAHAEADARIVASGSGEALSDSLRAYNLPAFEAVPASAPLAMNGAVMALWTAPDGKSVLATVRDAPSAYQPVQYEVDRVSASCN